MSSATLCVYCEQLPMQKPGSSARVARCPLCHSPIGSTSAGAKFRVFEGSAPLPRRASAAVVYGLGTIALAVVITLGLLIRSSGHVGQPAQVPAQAESSVNLPEDTNATAASATPAVETPNPDAAVKPYGARWRYRPSVKAPPYPAKATAQVPMSDAAPSFGSARPYYGQGPSYDLALVNLLKQTPEIALHEPFPKTINKIEARARIAKFLEEALVINRTAKEADAFVRKLLETRADLEGLPFLLGKACRLEPEAASRLAVAAAMVRSPVGRGGSPTTTMSMTATNQETYPFGEFWRQWKSSVDLRSMAVRLPSNDARKSRNTTWDIKTTAHVQTGIGALSQILGGEEARLRKALVTNLATQENSFAAKALVKFAVFDADHEVRESALVGLRHRRAEEYAGELAAAIRYPWTPAARHAAEAIARLDVKEAIPSLIDFLDEANPAAPFTVEKKGKKVFAIRELVRVNHHRNCQLCHAPADPSNRDDPGQVLANVPSPCEPLPTTISLVYYGSHRSGIVAVRADTTYLRQDFSALLPVADAGPWPDQQRFDFMIRTRVLDADETAMRQREAEPKCSSPHHEAALTALRQLTGHDYGPDAAAWRQVSGDGAFSRGVNKPAWGR